MKTQIEIEIPDGWEFVRWGAPAEGESFITVTGTVSPYYMGCGLYRVVIRPVWQWPAWLRFSWLAMDANGSWYAYENEPLVFDEDIWYVGGEKLQIKLQALDFTPPPCTDWRQSKRRRQT